MNDTLSLQNGSGDHLLSDLPEPMTPPDSDLRGMPYMPLDITRLFDSDIYALSTGDEFKAALTLWGKSFYQVPAGSLPCDERLLAHLSGSKKWKAVRIMALRGWVKCSDGRLYHKTVAEKVAQSWNSRLDSRARTEAARSAKARKKHESPNSPPSAVESVTDTDAELVTSSKGTEQKGTEQNNIERGKEEPPIIPQTTPAQQPVAKAPKNKPRSQLPVNWVPNADGLKLAKSLGLPDETILRFTDYHRSKGSLMADWNAAWGTWCRSPYNKPGASKISSAEANNRRIAELHAELMGDQPPPPADMFAGQTVEGDFAYV